MINQVRMIFDKENEVDIWCKTSLERWPNLLCQIYVSLIEFTSIIQSKLIEHVELQKLWVCVRVLLSM